MPSVETKKYGEVAMNDFKFSYNKAGNIVTGRHLSSDREFSGRTIGQIASARGEMLDSIARARQEQFSR